MVIFISVIKLVIDNQSLDLYSKYYFKQHPRARKSPIPFSHHPSINQWMIMKRPQMNATKQKWKDFMVWVVSQYELTDKKINKCEMRFVTYFETHHRHDNDNNSPKFILDGLTESGLIVDDDSEHVNPLILECYVDKENPRTEIYIYY